MGFRFFRSRKIGACIWKGMSALFISQICPLVVTFGRLGGS